MVSTKMFFKSLAAALCSVTVLIAGCGGGGATDPFAVTPIPRLIASPGALNIYAGTPSVITISSGTGPFQVFSSDSVVLPVTQVVAGAAITLVASNVAADTSVTLTIRDAAGQSTTIAVSVKTSPLLGALTITPTSNTTCAGATASVLNSAAICSGESGVASITVRAANSSVLPNRQIRFDVVQGNYNFLINQGATVAAKTQTLTTDQNGKADVVIRTDSGTPSAAALIRATDLTSGNRVDSAFTIVQAIDGKAVLSIVPDTYNGAGGFTGECVSFAGDYVVYGGTAPYTVTNGLPNAGTLTSGTSIGQVITVTSQGGIFRFTSNSISDGCGGFKVPLTIADATGRIKTVEFVVTAGSTARAPAVFSPASVTFTANQGGSAAVAEIPAVAASCSDGSAPAGAGCGVTVFTDALCSTGAINPTRTGCVVPAAVFTSARCTNGATVYATTATSCAQATYDPGRAARPAVAATPNTQCSARSVIYTLNGGLTPYILSASNPGVVLTNTVIATSPSSIAVNFPTLAVGVVTLTAVDAKGTLFAATATCAAGN